ncbi:MAG: hypothetical protein IPJ61_20330 [Tessaracoccus sp.]|uniref:phage head spike fiber domain-containing protein n=1 Tax=Tessaracoccus sp. TaxID=1971211 RepID=UPI001ECD1A52|nr:hypothetical protein [Tessaracoccus sp.]MBK7823336.1 hypothetical protein [Tessaracoccus sp.]
MSRLISRLDPTAIRFDLLAPGTPLPAGALPGGGTYTQAAGAGQTEETWVTSWTSGTLGRMAFVADTPKIGAAPNGLVGLRLRASWKNYLRSSDDFTAWTATGTSVATPDTDVSPDGLTNADTLNDDNGAGYEFVTSVDDAVPNDTETYRLEVFVKKTSGATHALSCNWVINGGIVVARSLRLNANDGTATGLTFSTAPTFGASWWRWRDEIVNNASGATAIHIDLYPSSTTIPLRGLDTGAGTGAKVVYGASVTRGKLPRDYQPTPSGSGATCADCAATYPASRLVRGGRLKLRFRWTPAGAPGDYNANFRLVDHGAETTYVEFSATDQKLRVVVAGGAAEVCAVPMWWPSASLYSTSHPVVEMDIEIGGGVATRIRYRYSTDAGATWTLPFDPLGGTAGVAQANVSGSGSIGVLTGAAAGNVADGWLHEHEAILTAPAWALQWLPTDDASVKAALRPDGHYVLSAGTTSSWTSQTATAVSVAQATGANQPTYSAAGVNGKPGFAFDGVNDLMTFSGLASAATDLLVVAALVPTSTGASQTLFDAQTGRVVVATQDGVDASTVGYYDGAWRQTGAKAAGAQILSWDLRSGSGRVFRNGVQIGSTLGFTPQALGGTITLGAQFSAAAFMQAILGGFVLSTTPSDALRRQIEAYMSATTGIAVS